MIPICAKCPEAKTCKRYPWECKGPGTAELEKHDNLAVCYKDGSEITPEEFWYVVEEEEYNEEHIERIMQRGFIAIVENSEGRQIGASRYNTVSEIMSARPYPIDNFKKWIDIE